MDVAEPPPKRIRLSPPPPPSSNSAREPVIADSTDPSPAPPPAPPAATTAEELPPPNPGAEMPVSVASSPLSAINSDGDLPRSGGHEDTTGMTTVEDGEPKEDDAWRRGGGPADETGDEGPSSTAVDAGEANADDTDADATPVASTPAPPLVGSATALGIAAPSESSPLDSGTRQEALSTRDGTTDAPQAIDASASGDPVATPESMAAALTAPATEETLGSLRPPQPTAAASIAAGPVSSPPVQHGSAPGPAPAEEEATVPSALGEDALVADAPAAASGGSQGGTAPVANATAVSPAAAPATAAIAPVQGEAPLKDSTASPAADPTGTDQTPPDPLPPTASIPSEPASSTQPQLGALASAASSNAPVEAPLAAESAPVSAAVPAPENPAPFADASNPAPTPAAIPQPAAVPVAIRVSEPEPEPEPEPEDPFTVPQSEAYRAVRAASQWNSLLGWARSVRLESSPGGAERGWDFATGMYHVPRNSPAYTANVPRATPESLAASSSKKPLPALSLHSTPSSMLYSQNPDVANLSDDDGPGTGGVGTPSESLFTESGRPRRSRAAMTRG